MLIIFAGVCWLVPAAPAQEAGRSISIAKLPAASPIARQWLVLIAIDDYAHKHFLNDLQSCKRDALALRNLLFNRFGYSSEHTIQLFDAQATRRAIERTLYDLIENRVGPEDSVLLAFSGHGYYDENTGLGYWYPHDAETKADGISNSLIRDWCASFKARKVLIVADSCFAGALLVRSGYTPDATRKSRELLAAGGMHPVADSGSPDRKHSIFNYYLRASLERLADKGQAFVTNDLYVDLFVPVKTNSEQEPQKGILQHTFHEGGQFLFYPRGSTPTAAAPPPPPASLPSMPSTLPEAPLAPPVQAGTPALPPAPAPGKSNTAARAAYDELLAAIDQRNMPRANRIAYLDDFLRDWSGTSAADDAQQQIARLRELETLAAEAVKAYAALESRESAEVLTKSQADLRRAAWDDYLAKYAATEHQVAEARQRRDRWAAWTPVTPTPARPETGFVQPVDLGGGVTMNLVYIRGGTFTMGLSKIEQDKLFEEIQTLKELKDAPVDIVRGFVDPMGPQTRVTLTEDFWMGETEVTQAQWKAVMGSDNNPSHWKGDNLPVESIFWNDAMEFCKKLTEHGSAGVSPATRGPDGRAPLRFTLPTEAQWEYACRAGTTTRYSFGDSDSSLGDYVWYNNNSGGKTQPVKTKKPNDWGLYDMHGNVWEWCLDWAADKLPGGSVTNPTGPSSGSDRVFRGGGWYNSSGRCRSAFRNGGDPGIRSSRLGLRVLAPGH
jgi:formylglycine-generating enzyme required for sulfatase activity